MKHIYVAGPYRGENAWKVEKNIREAENFGYLLAELGAVPVIPHTMYRFWDGTLTAKTWLEITLSLLKRCDAVVMLDGWSNSEGSLGEYEEAKRLRIPIFYPDETLKISGWLYE